MDMNARDEIAEQIKKAVSFRAIISLREKVWSLSGSIDLNDFLDLRDRVEKKVRDFDNPLFGNLGIAVVYMSGERKIIDSREVELIVGKGKKISEHVFSTFPEAVDFELVTEEFQDPMEKMAGDDELSNKLEINDRGLIKSGILRESIERIVRLAMKLANLLYTTYSKSFPNIAGDLLMIKQKLEELFEKVSTSYY